MRKRSLAYLLSAAVIFGLITGIFAMTAINASAEGEAWVKVDFTTGAGSGYEITGSKGDGAASGIVDIQTNAYRNFTIPEEDLVNKSDVVTGLQLWNHNSGFSFGAAAGLFEDDDTVFIDVEWYWPSLKTKGQTRVNAEVGSGSANKVFGDNGISQDRLQSDAGCDVDKLSTFLWRGELTSSKLYPGKDNKGIHFMFWHSTNRTSSEGSNGGRNDPLLEYVVVLSVKYHANPQKKLVWADLLNFINDGGGENELKTLYYDGAEDYREA
ncbi:MAG: hypothetical protein FWE80_06145, partial [Oscillospiraceae bacterium]|nr:hypothetical protein [Oscillospiraceae bacterium]